MNELLSALVAGLKLLTPGYLRTLTDEELDTLETQLRWASEDVEAEELRREGER